MGMIESVRRLRYVWIWRARYWWLDTRQGEIAHWIAMCVFALVALASASQVVLLGVQPMSSAPREAIWPAWVIQLIIALVSAAISYAMRPRPQPPQPQNATVPTTEDGLAARHYFGECWVEDEFQLAYKVVATTPIKTKAGKK